MIRNTRIKRLNTNKRNISVLKLILIWWSITGLEILAENTRMIVTVSNEIIEKGVSVSYEEPGVQFDISYDFNDQFFAGLQAIKHPTTSAAKRQGWTNLYIGYFSEITPSIATQLTFESYTFDADFYLSWDYSEWNLDLYLGDEHSVTYSVADSYYGFGDHTSYLAYQWQHILNEHYMLSVVVGQTFTTHLEYLDDFRNYEISLIRQFNDYRLSVGYYHVDKEVAVIQGERAVASRFAITLEYDLF